MNDWWLNVCGTYIVINLLEDTSAVSLASCIKVKAAAGPHAYWWADEAVLQNWVIGSVLITIRWQWVQDLCIYNRLCQLLNMPLHQVVTILTTILVNTAMTLTIKNNNMSPFALAAYYCHCLSTNLLPFFFYGTPFSLFNNSVCINQKYLLDTSKYL